MEIKTGSRVRYSDTFRGFFGGRVPGWVTARKGTVVSQSHRGDPMTVKVRWDGDIYQYEPIRRKSLEVVA